MAENARAAVVIKRAREYLRPYAELPPNAGYFKRMNKNGEMGAPETLGVLLRVAAIEIDGPKTSADDGVATLSPAAFVHFQREGLEVMEMMQSVTLNWSVILSLFLTIYVAMAVMHTGSAAYAPQGAQRVAFVGADGLGQQPPVEFAWGDLASYAWPNDPIAAAGLRRGLYVAECVSIIAGIVSCLAGIVNTVSIYDGLSVGTPNIVMKFEYILENPKGIGALWVAFDANLFFFLPASVAFSCARSSAIMSLTAFAGWGLVHVLTVIMTLKGTIGTLHLAQYRQARLLLGIDASPIAPAERAQPVTATAWSLGSA